MPSRSISGARSDADDPDQRCLFRLDPIECRRQAFHGKLDTITKTTPFGYASTPEGIAFVVALLATAEPLLMIGKIIDVDDGANIC